MSDPLDDFSMDEPTEDFDDIDMSAFLAVADTAEKKHRSGQITFVPNQEEDDPSPPQPLPEDTPSFHPIDVNSLRTWTYPVNYPIRGYQLNIVQKALFHNTLVALPTGLGKTFIAAVVMFNYWRWFPNSKVIFMAPTRPLVDQQIEACFRICGLPQSDTCYLTGSTQPTARRSLWNTKRVFFATPQTIQKDIINNACPSDQVVCIVVDEAHKSTGNYAYVDVVKRITKKHSHFRVLALTATPGSNLDAVQEVISNLCITHIQIRTEESMDIREYSHGKNIQNIIVRLSYTEGASGDIPSIINQFREKVFKPVLLDLSKLPTSVTDEPDKWGSYRLRSARVYFTTTAKNFNRNMSYLVISTFLLAESLSRAFEMLCIHGVGSFLDTMADVCNEMEEKNRTGKKLTVAQAKLSKNMTFKNMMEDLKEKRKNPDFVGHPKMEKLLAVLISHFGNLEQGKASKVMVFSSFRSSVMDICEVLSRHEPLIRATYFVGQATSKKGTKGLKQAEQQEVIQKFKSDSFNVIVSTSIGEEGLDIGEVDLIICYDSQASPIRMLQRMGRTGRQRQGKCIMLMTEQEEKKFAQAKETYSQIQRLITQRGILKYHPHNPTVIPEHYKPTIERKILTIGDYQSTNKRKRAPARDRSMISAEGNLTERATTLLLNSYGRSSLDEMIAQDWPHNGIQRALCKYVPLNVHEKPTFRIGHSRRTAEFVHLVQRIEHRIMHPGEDDDVPRRQQTRLVLPKKKPKKKVYDVGPLTVDDDDFKEFMENNDISHFMHPSESLYGNEVRGGPSRSEPYDCIMRDGDDPEINRKSRDLLEDPLEDLLKDPLEDFESLEEDPLKDLEVPSKGSEDLLKVPPENIKESLEDMNYLAERTFDDLPLKDKEKAAALTRDKGKSKAIEDSEDMISDGSWEAFLPPSVYEDELPWAGNQDKVRVSLKEAKDKFGVETKKNSMEIQIKKTPVEAPVEAPEGSFDDYLAPRFPFEKETFQSAEITFIWPKAMPEFSEKALQFLRQRQTKIKETTGQFIRVGVLEFNEPINSGTPTFDDDDVELLLAIPDEPVIITKGPEAIPEKKEEPAVVCEEKEQANDSLVEFDFDLFSNMDEFDLADLIENRLDEEQSLYHHFKGDNSSAQSKRLSSQASLYYRAKDETKEQKEEKEDKGREKREKVEAEREDESKREDGNVEDDDELLTFDFENMTQDSIESSPLFPSRKRTNFVINDDDEEEEEERTRSRENSGSSLLMQLSTGQYKSPLRNNPLLGSPSIHHASPLRATALPSQDSPSPIIHRRRKRIISDDSVDSIDIPSKRHRLIIPEDSEEDDDSSRQTQLIRRLKETSKNSAHNHSKEERFVNPFVDDEAEKSSDGGHTSEEEVEEDLGSFIDDDASSRASTEKEDIYRGNLLQDKPQQGRRKHWLDRINLDKYEEQFDDDDIINETDESIIEEFSSDLAPKQNIIVCSDDDFA
ncbi:hypothetical protein G6F56_003078 [Rhizopus delemar]|nr:hypothetical protein G6F56_003078 [Rhizopus delemar]